MAKKKLVAEQAVAKPRQIAVLMGQRRMVAGHARRPGSRPSKRRQLRLYRPPIPQQDPRAWVGSLRVWRPSRECHRRRQQRQKTQIALGLGFAACQKGLSVGFTTAAGLVHELL